ncbi:DNA repair exonuclease [Halobacillus sp. A5]|uniref:metallophosphoesterase family protein n=1 Tax=Halobacillus sp. A5 TaxID=2880263 RepID=UPI0020A62A3F|nr:DNA repair exonuclease [Halobacillus sp. A5]MCP3026763.1 DNA repair exonuclease [Halobacillus sp. A5]
MTSLKFIHSADLHLDSPFKGKNNFPEALKEQLRASTFEAYDRLIQKAILHHVDFVLLVGDLFNEEVRSLKAQVKLREGFERLKQHGIHVYVSYGNHDYMAGTHYPISYPENVHIFNEETVRSLPFQRENNVIAQIYGFSYEQRAVTNKMVQQFVKSEKAPFHIAMLHGSLETQTEHDVYAPFSMSELYKAQMDYWALGHIHKRQELSVHPPVIYPGNIQGRSHKEYGEKGCYLVEWKDERFHCKFLPLHSFTYERLEVDCNHVGHPQELELVFEEAKRSIASTSPMLLRLTLTSSEGKLSKWESEGLIEDWMELVNERETLEEAWVWIDETVIKDIPDWDEEELKKSNYFAGEFLRNIEEVEDEEFSQYVNPLYSHRRASKWLDELTSEERKEVMQSAKELVLQQIITRGSE